MIMPAASLNTTEWWWWILVVSASEMTTSTRSPWIRQMTGLYTYCFFIVEGNITLTHRSTMLILSKMKNFVLVKTLNKSALFVIFYSISLIVQQYKFMKTICW
jgi:hypothetical protein